MLLLLRFWFLSDLYHSKLSVGHDCIFWFPTWDCFSISTYPHVSDLGQENSQKGLFLLWLVLHRNKDTDMVGLKRSPSKLSIWVHLSTMSSGYRKEPTHIFSEWKDTPQSVNIHPCQQDVEPPPTSGHIFQLHRWLSSFEFSQLDLETLFKSWRNQVEEYLLLANFLSSKRLWIS